ncbi:MAG: CBS domain-containing protein, partial [Desulfuromonadales bacterium]|nr:CBS domain-containing protein [Desulfuromonadales bacterium]
RIGPFASLVRRGVEVHVYDHHPSGRSDLTPAVEYVEPVGATVTVLTEIFQGRGIEPTAEEATVMMLGLYEDTGSLTFTSTTVRDYQAAAFLLSHGANLNTVADSLTQELSADQVELLHQLIGSRTALTLGGIEISIAHASIDRYVGDLAVVVHKLRDMEGLDALIVAVRMGERVFLVGRSRRPEVHVGEIFAEFGGGGHSFAAAAAVRDLTLTQILERLPPLLRKHVNPRWEVRHLMSSPVKTVDRHLPIAQVREILTRYNINALPVVEGEQVVGILTRQVVEKAAHHGLSEVAAEEFMSGEFTTVAPETPVETLQELVVDRNQRFVPVMQQQKMIGCVTRTDLLRHLVAGARRQQLPTAADEAGESLTLKKRQVAKLLRDQLPPRVMTILRQMGEVADSLGLHIYAVGGFVRDLLLRQDNLDIDLVVEGEGIAFAAEYARRHRCRVRTHHKFGTAVIIFEDGFKVDIASTRMEYYVEPGALPTVEHASIKLDLYRRDFTINTL